MSDFRGIITNQQDRPQSYRNRRAALWGFVAGTFGTSSSHLRCHQEWHCWAFTCTCVQHTSCYDSIALYVELEELYSMLTYCLNIVQIQEYWLQYLER